MTEEIITNSLTKIPPNKSMIKCLYWSWLFLNLINKGKFFIHNFNVAFLQWFCCQNTDAMKTIAKFKSKLGKK